MPVLRFVNGDVGLLVHHSVQTDLSQQLSDGLWLFRVQVFMVHIGGILKTVMRLSSVGLSEMIPQTIGLIAMKFCTPIHITPNINCNNIGHCQLLGGYVFVRVCWLVYQQDYTKTPLTFGGDPYKETILGFHFFFWSIIRAATISGSTNIWIKSKLIIPAVIFQEKLSKIGLFWLFKCKDLLLFILFKSLGFGLRKLFTVLSHLSYFSVTTVGFTVRVLEKTGPCQSIWHAWQPTIQCLLPQQSLNGQWADKSPQSPATLWPVSLSRLSAATVTHSRCARPTLTVHQMYTYGISAFLCLAVEQVVL